MKELDYFLITLVVSFGLLYLTTIVYTVIESRRWNLPWWISVAAVLLFLLPNLAWIITAYASCRAIRRRGLDIRIARIKVALAWFVFVASGLLNGVCVALCRHAVAREFSDELANSCACFGAFLFMVFGLWLNLRLNALLKPAAKE